MQYTKTEYDAIDRAYGYFNAALFDDELPSCLITWQRHPKSRGYFHFEHFSARGDEGKCDEIALNPDVFPDRTDKEILSTLVHEMCHLWQYHKGKTSRPGYHNQEWAQKMVSVGLMPSSTGAPGGKPVGQHMTHYILPGGAFDKECDVLIEAGFKLNWESGYATGDTGAPVQKPKKPKSKFKYTCPNCKQNAWAKKDALLKCGECDDPMEMEEE